VSQCEKSLQLNFRVNWLRYFRTKLIVSCTEIWNWISMTFRTCKETFLDFSKLLFGIPLDLDHFYWHVRRKQPRNWDSDIEGCPLLLTKNFFKAIPVFWRDKNGKKTFQRGSWESIDSPMVSIPQDLVILKLQYRDSQLRNSLERLNIDGKIWFSRMSTNGSPTLNHVSI
jgi:hypothetical protein